MPGTEEILKKSEKLLDAIGQIDDRLVEEAAHAGKTVTAFAPARENSSVRHTKKKKKAAMYRWQGALAACAVLAVCVGIFGLLSSQGLLLSPFGRESSTAMEGAAFDMAAADQPALTAEKKETAVSGAGDGPEEAVEEAAAEEVQEAAEGLPENKDENLADAAAPEENVRQEAVSAETAENADSEKAGSESAGSEKAGGAEETAENGGAQNAETEPSETEGAEAEGELCGLPMLAAELEQGQAAAAGTEAQGEPEADSEADGKSESGQQSAAPAADITVRLLSCSAESVSWELSNLETDRNLYYGTAWELQQQTDAGWQTVESVKELVWKELLYVVKPGRTVKETADLYSIYGTLSSGSYRIVRECELGEEGQSYTLYVEFSVQ